MKRMMGKVALVTGGGSGIGRAICLEFANEGASVIVSDINESGGQETAAMINAAHVDQSMFVRADSSSAEDNKRLIEQILEKFGALHVACNNAGIGGPIAFTAEYPEDGWRRVIDTNLSGVFYGMRYQIPAMLQSGGGSIVNISSILGAVGTRMSPAYVAAKHGLVGLTKAAALEYADKNIRINTVGPGYIVTPMLTNNLDKDVIEQAKSLHPIGRLGKPEEVSALVTFLASGEASFITGSYFAVDGGYLAQ